MSKTRAQLHSPMPWKACEPGEYSDFAGNSRVILADDRRIAVVQGTQEQDLANAALIVAAPELLDAAQSALQLLEASLGVAHEACHALRDAINRATTLALPSEDAAGETSDASSNNGDTRDEEMWRTEFKDEFSKLCGDQVDREWLTGLAGMLYLLDEDRDPVEAAEVAFMTLGYELPGRGPEEPFASQAPSRKSRLH